jgi:hypothetical protein
MKFGLKILVSLLLCLTGCGSKDQTPTVDAAFKDAAPEQKKMVDEATAAFEKKDYETAVANLQAVRSDPNLTGDQMTAIQDRMAKYQTDLANRAEAGDKQAEATLRMLQAMPRR